MTEPETRDPATIDEPDFADEHTRPTYADENADDPGMAADESRPDDSGGMDVRGSKPI